MERDEGQDEGYVVNFQFLLEDCADRAAVTSALTERLTSLDEVGELNVSPTTTRAFDPVSIAATIGVSVLIIRQTADAVEALGRLVQVVRKLVTEIEGVSEARLEVGDQVRRFDELRKGDLEAAAKAALD